MKNLKRNLKIFFAFSSFVIKSTFQNRTGIVFFTIGKLIRFVLFFLFVYFLIAKAKLLKGYNVDHAIFFFLTYNIIDTVAQFLFREVYRFRWRILSGEFDTVLVKPYHPFLRILVGGVDILDLIMLVPYVLLTIYFGTRIGGVSLANLLLYVGLIGNALIIATAFHIAVLAFGIITIEVDQAIWIYRDLASLGRFPFEIYKEPIRTLFTFAIPIGVMMSFPPKALFGLLSINLIVFSFIFSFVLLLLSLKFWDFALKRYQSFGG